MEVLGGSRTVHHLEVAFLIQILLGPSHGTVIRVTALQVTLNTATGVLGAISVETVRQQHHKTITQVPFGLAGSHELIDHDLGAVCEITELGLPHRQRVGQAGRVTVLKAEHSVLRQMRATGDKVAALISSGLPNLADGAVVTVTILKENVSMSVRESSTLNILTRQTNMVSILNEGCKSQSFSSSPVDSSLLNDGLVTVLEDLDDIVVEFSVIWEDSDVLTNFTQFAFFNASQTREIVILNLRPLLSHPVFLGDLEIFALDVCLFHLCTA